MNIEPKTILWPTDFSPFSLEAVGFVQCYTKHFRATLHVVHVCAPLPNPKQFPEGFTMSEYDQNVLNTYLEAARNQLQETVQAHFSDIEPLHSDVLNGHPWSEVCEYAKGGQIDLIIMATHGKTGLRHALMGSVAERIVRHAPCPVLTVKHGK